MKYKSLTKCLSAKVQEVTHRYFIGEMAEITNEFAKLSRSELGKKAIQQLDAEMYTHGQIIADDVTRKAVRTARQELRSVYAQYEKLQTEESAQQKNEDMHNITTITQRFLALNGWTECQDAQDSHDETIYQYGQSLEIHVPIQHNSILLAEQLLYLLEQDYSNFEKAVDQEFERLNDGDVMDGFSRANVYNRLREQRVQESLARLHGDNVNDQAPS